jgi:hypothetical protein
MACGEIDPSRQREHNQHLIGGLILKDWSSRKASDDLRELGQGQVFAPVALTELPAAYRAAGRLEAKPSGLNGKRKARPL